MDNRLRVFYNEVIELPYGFVKCRNNGEGWVLYKGNKRVGDVAYEDVKVAEPDRLIVTVDHTYDAMIDDNGKIVACAVCESIEYAGKYYAVQGFRTGGSKTNTKLAVVNISKIIDRDGELVKDYTPMEMVLECGMILLRDDIGPYKALNPDLETIYDKCEVLRVTSFNDDDRDGTLTLDWHKYIKADINGKFTLVKVLKDNKLDIIMDRDCDRIYTINGKVILMKGNKVGILKPDEDELSVTEYDNTPIEIGYDIVKYSPHTETAYIVQKDKKFGLLSYSCEVILNTDFDMIEADYSKAGVVIVSRDGNHYRLTASLKKLEDPLLIYGKIVDIPKYAKYKAAQAPDGSWVIIHKGTGKPINSRRFSSLEAIQRYAWAQRAWKVPLRLGSWCTEVVPKGELQIAKYENYWYLFNNTGLRISDKKYRSPNDVSG